MNIPKNIFVCLIILVVCSSLYAGSNTWLTDTVWGPEQGYKFFGAYLRFYQNGSVTVKSVDQGGGWIVNTSWTNKSGIIKIEFPVDVQIYTLKRKLIISPSFTVYSLPSRR